MIESNVKIIDAEQGIISISPARKKLAIVGFSDSVKNAPYDDDNWEIWGLNEPDLTRAERYFEMHPMGIQNDRELLWLQSCDRPVYLLDTDCSIPMGVKYPLDLILGMKGAKDYFTSTFAYQVALALLEGFKEIGLWGVNLPYGSPRERTIERTCLEWWLGFAAGKGIKIHIPEGDSLLLYPYRYGYHYFYEKNWAARQMDSLGLQIALRNDFFAKRICNL